MDDPNFDLVNDISLLNNYMISPPELEEQNLPKYNKALISIVSLALLCYLRNKCSNLFQKIINHYAFSANILKRFIELLQ